MVLLTYVIDCLVVIHVIRYFLVEMQRIRKDSETMSNSGYSTVSRARRESDRHRNDPAGLDNANIFGHRNVPTASMIREVR
jgi:hypothetical protein